MILRRNREGDALTSDQKQRIVLYIFLLLAAAEFIVRGPVRYLHPTNWNDLAQNYAATRVWLRGQNFADPRNFVALWRDEVGSTLDLNTGRVHLAPPPGTLVILAPIAALPWPMAKLAWLGVLLVAFCLTLWALGKTGSFGLNEPRTVAFIAGCLALAPFHTGIATANQTILVVGLCALGVLAATGEHDFAAGLLFGAACSLKPHIGSFLVLYYLIQRRWRLFITAVSFTAALALIAIGWMQISGVSWRADFFRNVNVLTQHNTIDDFTSANPIRFLLVNLQVPFYSFTHSAKSSNVLALSCGALLICVWMYLVLRVGSRRPRDFELLALAAIAVIGLLPIYHRLYDVSLLAIPLCWCLTCPSGRLKNLSIASLIFMLPFAFPTAAFLEQAVHAQRVPEWLVQSWAWERVIMPHQTYLLVGLAIVLLRAISLTKYEEPA